MHHTVSNNQSHTTFLRHPPRSNHLTPLSSVRDQNYQQRSMHAASPTSPRSTSAFAMPVAAKNIRTIAGEAAAPATHANGVNLLSFNADVLRPTSNAVANGTSSPKVKQSSNGTPQGSTTDVIAIKPTEFGDYLSVASHQLALAAQRESQGEYAVAYDLYNLAVDILLRGVQTDNDQHRRDAVRRKTTKYLKKAESIYSAHIVNNKNHKLDTAAVISSSVTADAVDSNLPQTSFSSQTTKSCAKLKGTEKDLHRYRVVGSLAESVLLVLSPPPSPTHTAAFSRGSGGGETLCMKVLRKAAVAEPASSSKPNRYRTIVPTALPFMVPLVQFIETPDAIYLLTAWAKGGKLFDYIQKCCKNPYEVQGGDSPVETLPSPTSPRRLVVDQQKPSTMQNSILAFVRRYGKNNNNNSGADADDEEEEVVTQSTTINYTIPFATTNETAMHASSAAARAGKEREVISISVGRTHSVANDDDDEDAAPQTLSGSISSSEAVAAVDLLRRSTLMTRSNSETFSSSSPSQKSRPEFLTTKSMLFDDDNRPRSQSKPSAYIEHAHITVRQHALDPSRSAELRRKNANSHKLHEKVSISDAVHHHHPTKSISVAKEECLIKKFMHADHFSTDARAEECEAMNAGEGETAADIPTSKSSYFLPEDDLDDDTKPIQHCRPTALAVLSNTGKEQERLEISTIKKTVRRGSIQSNKNLDTHEKLIPNVESEETISKNGDFETLLMDYTSGHDADFMPTKTDQQHTSSLATFSPTTPAADTNMLEFDLNNWEASAAVDSAATTPDAAVSTKRASSNYDLLTQELSFDCPSSPNNNSVVNDSNVDGGRRSSQSADGGHDSGWWPSTSSIENQQQYEVKLDPFGNAVLNRSTPSLSRQPTLSWATTTSKTGDGEATNSRARHVSADIAVGGSSKSASHQPQHQRNSMTSTCSSSNSASDTLDALNLVARARELMSRVDERLNSGHDNAENVADTFAVENQKHSDIVRENNSIDRRSPTLSTRAVTSNVVKQRKAVSERMICTWLAELVIVVDALHQTGIFVGDLNPDNVLLGTGGHVCLTYISQWRTAPRKLSRNVVQRLYAAPELRHHNAEIRAACDVWSIGAIAFELFTHTPLYLHHNNGAVEVLDGYYCSTNSSSTTAISSSCLPAAVLEANGILAELVSAEARDLLARLLRYKPEERLSLAKMREHPFFRAIDWTELENVGMSLSSH